MSKEEELYKKKNPNSQVGTQLHSNPFSSQLNILMTAYNNTINNMRVVEQFSKSRTFGLATKNKDISN